MGEGSDRHQRRIDRSFAIACKEVSVEQFLQFRQDERIVPPERRQQRDCPATLISWYLAAGYCNWLSEQEGIPKDQWCYRPNGTDIFHKGLWAEGMEMAPNYLERTGYRLPTEAEWEYACRAGAATGFSFGETDELLGKYAWFLGNSPSRTRPVGTLRPNDLGLFDMHGNTWEWCQDRYKPMGAFRPEEITTVEDKEDMHIVKNTESRMLRGGSFNTDVLVLRCAFRSSYKPTQGYVYFGFRPVRTFHSSRR
jgi:formylglycine-generating enzyme required for sulfatase activity